MHADTKRGHVEIAPAQRAQLPQAQTGHRARERKQPYDPPPVVLDLGRALGRRRG
ncbi:MAG: hypothetical protein JO120_08310 [Solirubrobacterales bacterium]|nr:hypothetical protein [Solirubrobacterales bacterium]